MQVLGIRRIASEKLINTGRNQIWFCDGCENPFIWDSNSSIYGSVKDEENGDYHKMWIACSGQCKAKKPQLFPKGIRLPKGPIVMTSYDHKKYRKKFTYSPPKPPAA